MVFLKGFFFEKVNLKKKKNVWSGSKLLWYSWKIFFEKVNLKKKNPQTTKKHAKLPSMQRVKSKQLILLPTDMSKNCWMSGKQHRPWSDATFLPGYTLFCLFVLILSQPNGAMSSMVSSPNHTYWADLVL